MNKQCKFLRCVTHYQTGMSKTLGYKFDFRIAFSLRVLQSCVLQAFPPTNKVIYAKHRPRVLLLLLLLLLGKRNLIIVLREIHNLGNMRLCF